MKPENAESWAIRSKVWLEFEGKPIIGEGRISILDAIHSHGSLLQAAKLTGVSYRRVRGAIRDMEHAVGRPLVESFRGGGQGGGAKLTPTAHELMDSYKKIAHGVQDVMDFRFKEIFR
jgi:molybdate transport system regulatory protein